MASPAWASSITYQFNGAVDFSELEAADPATVDDALETITAGSLLHGSLTWSFDDPPIAVGTNPAHYPPQSGFFMSYALAFDGGVSVAGSGITTALMSNNAVGDEFAVDDIVPISTAQYGEDFGLHLRFLPQAFDTTAMPTSLPLDLMTSATFSMVWIDNTTGRARFPAVRGHLTSIEAVPTASTLVYFVMGLPLIVLKRSARSR